MRRPWVQTLRSLQRHRQWSGSGLSERPRTPVSGGGSRYLCGFGTLSTTESSVECGSKAWPPSSIWCSSTRRLYSCFTNAFLMLYWCFTRDLLVQVFLNEKGREAMWACHAKARVPHRLLAACFTRALLVLYACFTRDLLVRDSCRQTCTTLRRA